MPNLPPLQIPLMNWRWISFAYRKSLNTGMTDRVTGNLILPESSMSASSSRFTFTMTGHI
ncbi:hypothetical protein BMETH_2376_0 [methanotrophic bacterial endosymbiont of Bathymodiolus sp.]|nr:hypothetical protein BMETH_2376_0 [methanotrophic bacterial endosymbiont of Bathymodiolus sp.]